MYSAYKKTGSNSVSTTEASVIPHPSDFILIWKTTLSITWLTKKDHEVHPPPYPVSNAQGLGVRSQNCSSSLTFG